MALIVNGTTYNWWEKTIIVNGSTISSPDLAGEVYAGGTKVFGVSDFSSETTIYGFGLAPDSPTFENTHIPYLLNNTDAILNYAYQSGLPGSDTRWFYNLKKGYRFVTSDGTFTGGVGNETQEYNGVDYTGYLWEGRTVTGANTSHNGGTSVSLRRDDGV